MPTVLSIKIKVLVVMVTVFNMSFAFAQQVTISGKVTASTCQVNNGKASISITLPQLSVSALSFVGATAGATPFEFSYANCTPGIVSVTPYFEPNSMTSPSGRVKQFPYILSPMKNVELQIKNSDGTIVDLSKSFGQQKVNSSGLVSNSGSQRFIAEYYATGVVQPGRFYAYLRYSLVYQ
ncbi:fimbrial protein [Rhodoferax aquaticus]|uniref:Type 1 fimbrial protein n=1 Tax=Rhodoferax aquaticus TaxID=2527691 RepID=A0A515ET08_9BURK|nr:fimbrial protein [Rhodoferax aquaticus]QDL55768.1 type 1 fimbrial protein [Rhodoferax aquaticus]